MEGTRQRLTLLEKTVDGVRRKILADVLYVSLRGRTAAAIRINERSHRAKCQPFRSSSASTNTSARPTRAGSSRR